MTPLSSSANCRHSTLAVFKSSEKGKSNIKSVHSFLFLLLTATTNSTVFQQYLKINSTKDYIEEEGKKMKRGRRYNKYLDKFKIKTFFKLPDAPNEEKLN